MENTNKAALDKKLAEFNDLLKANGMEVIKLDDLETKTTTTKTESNKWLITGCVAGGVVTGVALGYFGKSFIDGLFR